MPSPTLDIIKCFNLHQSDRFNKWHPIAILIWIKKKFMIKYIAYDLPQLFLSVVQVVLSLFTLLNNQSPKRFHISKLKLLNNYIY